jgi:ArsR family metal-binding transcriptional regulator
MTKYTGLNDYLKLRTEGELTLTFDEIADIINGYLPKSAEQSQYWENAAKMCAGHKHHKELVIRHISYLGTTRCASFAVKLVDKITTLVSCRE